MLETPVCLFIELVVVAPVIVFDFTTSAYSAKFSKSVLSLIAPAERPVVHSAIGRDVDSLILPENVVASSLFLGDLDLNIVELEFVFDVADEAESVVKSAIVLLSGDVVIDGDSHLKAPCYVYVTNIRKSGLVLNPDFLIFSIFVLASLCACGT